MSVSHTLFQGVNAIGLQFVDQVQSFQTSGMPKGKNMELDRPRGMMERVDYVLSSYIGTSESTRAPCISMSRMP